MVLFFVIVSLALLTPCGKLRAGNVKMNLMMKFVMVIGVVVAETNCLEKKY